MRIILVTGGARSGKSRWAQQRALEFGGDHVTVVATAERTDPEMASRIAAHRQGRPKAWTTVETPGDIGAVIGRAKTEVVLLECLTMACANALTIGPERVKEEVEALLAAADDRQGVLIVVTNEVGLGVVPATESGRAFRDVLGAANQRLATRADEVVLMVSGIPVPLVAGGVHSPHWMLGPTGWTMPVSDRDAGPARHRLGEADPESHPRGRPRS